jgi:polar amino acid transport system ATP-binding protein
MLQINNLSKKFGHKIILDNVSLEVPTGHIALLLGASGVGKSTLLRILNNLETADAGQVELNGSRLDLAAVNKTHIIGMVFQQFNLFEHMTVEQNITFALEKALGLSKEKAHERAHQLLKKYGLEDKAHVYASQLSGGQKQRLAIARTLALKPKVVCLDEPTSALDPSLRTSVANAIQELAEENYTVLVASHDTSLIKQLNCTIYLMDQGKIVEAANSQDFWKNPASYPLIKYFVEGH